MGAAGVKFSRRADIGMALEPGFSEVSDRDITDRGSSTS
jgi:hypothetical protein